MTPDIERLVPLQDFSVCDVKLYADTVQQNEEHLAALLSRAQVSPRDEGVSDSNDMTFTATDLSPRGNNVAASSCVLDNLPFLPKPGDTLPFVPFVR